MLKRLSTSTWVAIALGSSLLVSLAFHAFDLLDGPDDLRVEALDRTGPEDRPTLLLDFNAAMVSSDRLGEVLEPGLVSLDPPVPVRARFLTLRRLAVVPIDRLPPFTKFQVRFGQSFADVLGRPVNAEEGADLAFESRRLRLRGDPSTFIDERGRAVVEILLTDSVRAGELRASLRLDDDGWPREYDLTGKDATWRIVLDELPEDALVLVLDGGSSTGWRGEVGLAAKRYRLRWPRSLAIRDVDVDGEHPERRIVVSFSRVLAKQDVRGFVELKPEPENLFVRREGRHLILTGRFDARRTYRVRVREGLRSIEGLALAQDMDRPVEIPPPPPRVAFEQGGRTLSAAARPEIQLGGINVPAVEVTLREVYPSNVAPLALKWAKPSSLSAPAVEKRIAIDAAPDEPWTRPLDLAALLGRAPRGVYHIEIRGTGRTWTRDSRLLQVTDLAPIVRIHSAGVVAFVRRISDGTPVADAEVALFDKTNQPCASGRTNADGLFVARSVTGDACIATVRTSDDMAWVDLKTHGVAHAPRDVAGAMPAEGLEAFVWADRGAVRPGETAHLGAIVRAPGGGAPPEGLPLEVHLKGPDGRVIERYRRPTDAHGAIALDVAFALDTRTGAHTIEVHTPGADEAIGTTAFRVDTIVPDRIEPSLHLPQGDLAFDQALSVGVAARLLTGEPAAGLEARLRVRFKPLDAQDEDGFVFGDPRAAPSNFSLEPYPVDLDDEGRAKVVLQLPKANEAGVPLRATFELEVVDVSGRAAFTRETRKVFPAGPRLGLARPQGAAFQLAVALRGADATKGEALLERARWRGAWIYEGDRTVWRSETTYEPIRRVAFEVVDGRGRASFPDPGDGRYRVRVEAASCLPAAVSFERWDGATHALAGDAGAPRLEVAAVDAKSPPGTTATLRLDAPFAGAALLTFEGSNCLEARSVDIPAGASLLEVELPETEGHEIHATLTLVRGAREAGERPARVLGAARIALDRPERGLGLTLDLPEEALPETTLRVRVSTSAPSTVRLHVVDEGVLRLTGHETPSPLAHFEAPRRLETKLADVYASLLERMRFGGEDAETGGGDALARRLDPTAKKTIFTVALASKLVECDGECTILFDLPSWEGRLRVFAVAAGAEGVGSAEASLVVKAPVSLAIHVPRAVAPGDVFDVGVEVRGERVAWDAVLDGLERTGESSARSFRVRALDQPGVARVTVSARDAHGNQTKREALLSVRPTAPFAVRHVVRTLLAGEEIDETLPGRWFGGTRRARFTVGVPGVTELLPALGRLVEYPHGCVEQTVSRSFPVLAWSELAGLAHPEGMRPEDTIMACIRRLRRMQTPSGGLTTWPGGSSPYPWGSAYAAHFLVEAKRLGRPVPDGLLEPLLEWMEARLRRGDADAYTARVLALAGRPVLPHLDPLLRKAKTTEARADLAAALFLAGSHERAETLLSKVGDPWKAPREQGGTLSSPVRAASTLLGALVDARPDDPRIPALVLRLRAAARAAAKQTTQENAAALLALSKAYALRAEREMNTHGILEVDGVEHAFGGGVPLVVDIGPDEAWRYRIRADGATTLVVRLEGIPVDDGEEEEDDDDRGLEISRRIDSPDGRFRQGHVYRVVLEGRVPHGSANVLVTDVLPGGFEIEKARGQAGTLAPDRVEPRDDRVLFFRTADLSGRFRQTYLVRAVTPGRYRLPPVACELLYDPELSARTRSEGFLEVVR